MNKTKGFDRDKPNGTPTLKQLLDLPLDGFYRIDGETSASLDREQSSCVTFYVRGRVENLFDYSYRCPCCARTILPSGKPRKNSPHLVHYHNLSENQYEIIMGCGAAGYSGRPALFMNIRTKCEQDKCRWYFKDMPFVENVFVNVFVAAPFCEKSRVLRDHETPLIVTDLISNKFWFDSNPQ